jgi:hypothetical protein
MQFSTLVAQAMESNQPIHQLRRVLLATSDDHPY